MKKNIITIVIMSIVSVSASAATFHDAAQVAQGRSEAGRYGSAISQGREAAAHSERYGSHAIASNVAKAEANGATHREAVAHEGRYSGMASKAVGEAQAAKVAQNAAIRAEQLSHEARYSGIVQSMKESENQARTASQLNALAQAQEQQAHTARYAGMNPGQPTNSTINQSVTSVKPDTHVSVTVNGVTTQTTAGEIAKTNPQAQISMPMDSVFTGPVHTGNNDHAKGSTAAHGGTGNGANNAQNSRSAGGLADSHVGGGRSGGGFHY